MDHWRQKIFGSVGNRILNTNIKEVLKGDNQLKKRAGVSFLLKLIGN
jgi:hypothetical protein